MATYKFYFSTDQSSNLEEEYTSSLNINEVQQEFKDSKGNIISITRIDIIADPDLINTDEALGIVRK